MGSVSRRWLIFLPVAILALWSTVAKADGLGDWTASQSCATGNVNVVENSIVITGPDGGGCTGANWVKIETTIPEDVDTVLFTWSYWTNDGWWYDPPQYGINGVYTLLTQQNQATGSLTVEVTAGDIFTFRQYSTDSCCQPGHLTISDLSLWEFTTTSTTPTTTTTTTTVPEETVPVTSTTTTTVPETTTTTSTSTTTTSTSTTTSTTSTSTTSTTSTTTTSSTLPAPVETYAPVTLPETTTSTTTTTVAETTTTVTLPPETTTTTVPATTTTQEATTTTEAPVETSTTVEPNLEPNLERLEDEVEIPAEEAVALATNPEVLAEVTPQQAVTIFESLDVANLDDTEKEAIIEAVQSAPLEVRQAFEETINIFSDDFGDYVPLGSTVPVDTRRTLIAVAAGATTVAVSSRRR